MTRSRVQHKERTRLPAYIPVAPRQKEPVPGIWTGSLAAGRGGVQAVSQATRIARNTITRGLVELRDEALAAAMVVDRVRRPPAEIR